MYVFFYMSSSTKKLTECLTEGTSVEYIRLDAYRLNLITAK